MLPSFDLSQSLEEISVRALKNQSILMTISNIGERSTQNALRVTICAICWSIRTAKRERSSCKLIIDQVFKKLVFQKHSLVCLVYESSFCLLFSFHFSLTPALDVSILEYYYFLNSLK